MPAPLERVPQLPEVVDFTVEDDSDVASLVENGLMSARKVNNAEAAHPERYGWCRKKPLVIRAAMH
jgi:hypothetical protein